MAPNSNVLQLSIFRKIFVKPFITVLKYKNKIFMKGPLGVLFVDIPQSVEVHQTDDMLRVSSTYVNKPSVLTCFKLIQQRLRGVDLGFFEILIISGVGWRFAVHNSVLIFSIGYSHSVEYTLKSGIEIILVDRQKFKIFGLNLMSVRQTVAELCHLRPFDVYKGKGLYCQQHAFKLKISAKSKA